MINVTKDFLEGYNYALGLVAKGLEDMHEFDFDDRTLDMAEIYVQGLKMSTKIIKDASGVKE